MVEEESEFGRGLVINLVKFAEHFFNREAQELTAVKTWYELGKKEKKLFLSSRPPSYLNYGSDMRQRVQRFLESVVVTKHGVEHGIADIIETWANGASDHLYDMTFPSDCKDKTLFSKVSKLRAKGLEIGHGFTGKQWTSADINELETLTEEIAIEVDRKILKIKNADIGKY
jgi:hypothetical protein